MRKRFAASFVLLFCFALLAACQPQSTGVSIRDAWARPGLAGSNSAVYFTIRNSSTAGDELVKVSSDVADSVEIHMSSVDASGTMMMRPLEAVEIPAHTAVELEPGGMHVMLVGLNEDLIAGESITITLHFKNAANLTIEVPIKASAN